MQPFKSWEIPIYPDKEDPGAIQMFKKAGFKMKEWDKKPGSLVTGINIMRRKIYPMFGADPEFYVIRDVNEDPTIELLFRHLMEFHWKLDAAGKPTNIVADVNKDLPDSARYWIMNFFPDKLGGVTVASSETNEKLPTFNRDGTVLYSAQDWMTTKINEIVGDFSRVPDPNQRSMKIEPISYYGEILEDESGKKKKKGKKAGIFWDFN